MMTREDILSIEEYYAEHKISHKKRLEGEAYSSTLNVPPYHFQMYRVYQN